MKLLLTKPLFEQQVNLHKTHIFLDSLVLKEKTKHLSFQNNYIYHAI